MTTYLGIDYGTKRIGLAVAEDTLRVATPLPMVPTCPNIIDTISAIIDVARDYGADEFVVGLPLNMDGSEGPQAKLTRQFGDQLAGTAQAPVHYWDERLTSHEAEMKLGQTGFTHGQKKTRMDGIAAQILLQEFIEALDDANNDSNPTSDYMPEDEQV